MDIDKMNIDFLLKNTWQKVARMYNSEADKYNFTIANSILLLVIGKEGTPSGQLGPMVGMENSSLTRNLKNLEKKGLILRKKQGEDGRSVHVFLTKEGVEMRRLAKQKVVKFNKILRQNISDEKLKIFIEVLLNIQDLVEPKEIKKD